MINKRTSALFAIANSLYIIYFIILMIWLKEPIINDIRKQPVLLSNQVLAVIQIVMSVLSLLIFIGLAWVLTAYKEKLWITISVWVYLLLQLYLNTLSVLSIYRMPQPYLFYNFAGYVNYAVLLYLVVGIQFVRSAVIKNFYRWFGIMVLVPILFLRVSPLLYNKYGLTWALVNPGVVKLIPFFISLFLFVKLLKLKRAQ
jgi:hypothetical protein